MAVPRKSETAKPVGLSADEKAASTSKRNARVGNLGKRMHGAGGRTGYPK